MSGSFGLAKAIGHAGEILQGQYLEAPFLVSLPAPIYTSTAEVHPSTDWRINPRTRLKALHAAKIMSPQPLSIELTSNIPMGRGCGSSTADCVATIRAIARLQNRQLSSHEIAELTVASEIAADSTMFDREPIVFQQRTGKVLRSLGSSWPSLYVSVIDLGGPDVHTLDTLPPNYTSQELDEFSSLLDQCATAFTALDPQLLGQIATQSGKIHQRHHPHNAWPCWLEFAQSQGAYGLARSHSGTVAAILSSKPIKGHNFYTLGDPAKGI